MSSTTTYRLANEADVDLSASLMDRIKKRASGSRWTCSGTSRRPIAHTTKVLHQARSATEKLQQ